MILPYKMFGFQFINVDNNKILLIGGMSQKRDIVLDKIWYYNINQNHNELFITARKTFQKQLEKLMQSQDGHANSDVLMNILDGNNYDYMKWIKYDEIFLPICHHSCVIISNNTIHVFGGKNNHDSCFNDHIIIQPK